MPCGGAHKTTRHSAIYPGTGNDLAKAKLITGDIADHCPLLLANPQLVTRELSEVLAGMPDATKRKAFLEALDGFGDIEKLTTFVDDLANAPELVVALKGRWELVRAWEVVHTADFFEFVRRNVDNLRYVENHVATSSKTFDDVANELPKLGSFDNWVAWNDRWHLTDIILDAKVNEILDEFPDAVVGYRGSLATGQKYNGGNPIPFDPTSYDVDGFIVSNDFAAQFTGPGWRNARDNSNISSICDDLQDSFVASLQGYKHGTGEHPFTFRVWTVQEYLDIVEPAGAKLINP